MSIKTLNFLTSLILLISSSASFASKVLETGEEAPLTATKPQQPEITFKNFTFDPNTKRFEGGIFDEAQVVAGELGAYYTGKYQAVQKQLAQAREQLNALKQLFDPHTYKTLRSQKVEYGAEKFKQGDACETYKQLKTQHGEILLHKARVTALELKSRRYNEYREVMSSIPQLLQHIFYLTYLQPDTFYISNSQSYYGKHPLAKETPYTDLHNVEYSIRNLTKESLDGIDWEFLQKKALLYLNFSIGMHGAFSTPK